MSHELQPMVGFDGRIERFGASQKINDELISNFQSRGRQAAGLLIATLTETPFAPELDGQAFSVEVSNRYRGAGAGEGEGEDTVVQAAEALAEFTTAKVPGAKKVSLDTFKTNYDDIFDDLAPNRRTPSDQKQAFQQAFVAGANGRGVPITSYGQGVEIISAAPKKVGGLLLSSRDRYGLSDYGVQTHDFVTEHGRMLNVVSDRRHGLLGVYYDWYLPKDVSRRGGRAPGSTIVSEISNRVIHLATRSTRR